MTNPRGFSLQFRPVKYGVSWRSAPSACRPTRTKNSSIFYIPDDESRWIRVAYCYTQILQIQRKLTAESSLSTTVVTAPQGNKKHIERICKNACGVGRVPRTNLTFLNLEAFFVKTMEKSSLLLLIAAGTIAGCGGGGSGSDMSALAASGASTGTVAASTVNGSATTVADGSTSAATASGTDAAKDQTDLEKRRWW